MGKGWLKEAVQEVPKTNVQENLSGYQDKVSDLKKEEIFLKENIKNSKVHIDSLHQSRREELDVKEQELSNRCIEIDKIEVSAKSLFDSYNKKLADLDIQTSDFETYRLEKQAEIDKTMAGLATQKEKLDHFNGQADETLNTIISKKSELEKRSSSLEEKSRRLESENLKLELLQEQILASGKQLKTDQEEHAALVKADAEFRAIYASKNEQLENRAEQLKVLKVDLDEKAKRINERDAKSTSLALQVKHDTLTLEKQKADFNIRQKEITTQIEKLESLKNLLNNQVKEKQDVIS